MSERVPRDTGSPLSGSEDPRQPRADAISRRLCRSRVHERLFGKRLETLRIGRFILLERIGAGSMGEIYAAYDDRLDRKVAIKLLHDGLDTSPSARQRLLREAQTLARLSHPNVVHVYEVGEFQGRVFIAMEFVAGRTLREWLHTSAPPGRRPTMPAILRHFIAAGRGLEAAHDAGLVHRDFKPANVLIGDDGRARVVDFGLARAVIQPLLPGSVAVEPHAPDAALDDPELLRRAITQTTVGRLMGTPGYMSPEQLRGQEADHRSDQFSFCVALYEALHGKRPFAGDTLDQLRQTVQSGVIRESSRHIRVPASLHKALLRGLSTDPDKRFADMATLLRAIEEPTSRRRPWAWLMVGAVVPALVWLLISGGGKSADPCSQAGSAMDEVWNAERQERLAQVFARANVSNDWERVSSELDKYQHAWRATSVKACRATHVQRTRPASNLAHSTACLERGRKHLDALLHDLEREDSWTPVSSRHVLAVLAEVHVPETCTSPEYLKNSIEPPPAAIEVRVDEIREQLARAHTHRQFGRYVDAVIEAREALTKVKELEPEYEPLRAEARYEFGASLMFRGEPGDFHEAGDMLDDAARDALASHHDQLLVDIWKERALGAVLMFDATTDDAKKWVRDADAAIKRAGDTPRLRAMQRRLLGLLAQSEGRYDDAVSHHKRALDIADGEPDYPDTWRVLHLHDLATASRLGDDRKQAEIRYQEAMKLARTFDGKGDITHPRLAEIHFDLAVLAMEREKFDDAFDILRGVVKVHERALGSDHRLVGKAHLEIAKVLRLRAESSGRTDDLGRAVGHLQLAYDIYVHVYGENHVKLANIYELAGAIAYNQKCPRVALYWYERELRKYQATWKEDRDRAEFGYAWANIAEAKLDLGDHEGVEAAIHEAEKTRAPKHIKDFIEGVRLRLEDVRQQLENERDMRPRQPAPTPAHCQKPVLVLKTSPKGP